MAYGWLVGSVFGLGVLALGADSQAEGLRCGDQLASTGASLYEVRTTCGDPDDAQHSTETRTIRQRVPAPCPPGSERKQCDAIVEQTVEIAVDKWTYDFGSNRFIEFARFEQGVLVSVTHGGHGHKDPS